MSDNMQAASICTCADYHFVTGHATHCPVGMQAATELVESELGGVVIEETHRLVGWGDDAEFIQNCVLPRVFGHLVRLAAPVVQEYHSDLYRDAQWLPQNVTGEAEMDFVVRHHGTFLGITGAGLNMAQVFLDTPSNWFTGDIFYHLSLTVDDRHEWSLTITGKRLK